MNDQPPDRRFRRGCIETVDVLTRLFMTFDDDFYTLYKYNEAATTQ